MKNCLNGFFCLYLMAFWPAMGSAQQPPAPAPTPNPTAPPTPNPTAPPAAPPAAPPSLEPAPPQNGPIIQAPPELPKYPDTRMQGESGWWLGVSGWAPTQQPVFNKGSNSGITTSSEVTMQGTPGASGGVEFGIALGLHNALRVSGFQTRAAGNTTPTQDLTLWGASYAKGDVLSTNYSVKDLKFSFEYLTLPYPVGSRKWRLKTLWQLQYVDAKSAFDAPLKPLFDANGNPFVDASGNPISYATSQSKWILLPTLGVGFSEYFSRHVRLEANASGFAIPHHRTIWDTDFTVNVRVGHLEIGGGVKAFHFKTSSADDYYLKGTLVSPTVQLRFFSQ